MPEVEELSASRRFVAIETPVALPGACYTCRNDDGPFVDTGVSEDFFGQVIICKGCILEMAQNFDLPDPKEWKSAQRKIRAVQASNLTLREENKELREKVGAYDAVLGNFDRTDTGLSLRSSDAASDESTNDKGSKGSEQARQSFLSTSDDGPSKSGTDK